MPASRQRRVALASLIAFTLAALVAALPAGAFAKATGSGQPFDSSSGNPYGAVPNNSAGDQYVETLPTTKGPRAPGNGKHGKKLSRTLEKRLAKLGGGSDAAALAALATSPSLGAPTGGDQSGAGASSGKGKSSGKGGSSSRRRHGGSTPAVPSAAIKAVDGGEAGLGWLVVAILAITGLALGAVGYQRRRDKGSTN
jgi:hypothetical protein